MDLHIYRGDERPRFDGTEEANPITTEIIRRALNSAARQMARATVRTAFSVPVYEGLDFAAVLYDRHLRLLAQAPTSPLFMGTMSFCIEAAVAAVGGEAKLNPGDVLVYNKPYGTGSHAQDCAVIMPIFQPDGSLLGYAGNKAHWTDIAAQSIYCTNTTDVFQEGLVIPGVKLVSKGEWNEDLHRLILANSRAPSLINGDLNAQIASCHVGARELLRIVERVGAQDFAHCVERMIAHGEAIVRRFLETIPDGRYTATCHMDDNGIDDDPIRFDIAVEIAGSNVTVDFSQCPDAQRGPINCPLPTTVSGARVALAMLAGGTGNAHEIPNEGHFRPLSIITRPGSMFHPREPAPCFLYGWPIMSAMEGIYEALGAASPTLSPAGSAADLCGVLVYGLNADGEIFAIASPMPVGQGGHHLGDGHTLMVSALAQSTLTGAEIQEAKSPVLFEKWEFTPDSAGPGRHRGGHGWEFRYKVLQDITLISVVERTRTPGYAQRGGLSGKPNRFRIEFPSGEVRELRKITDLKAPAGTRIHVWCGGGGGYGDPAQRDVQAVRRDVRDGVVSAEGARRHYPQADIA